MVAAWLRNILYWSYSVRINEDRDLHLLSRILWSTEIKDLQEMGECVTGLNVVVEKLGHVSCVTNKIRFV